MYMYSYGAARACYTVTKLPRIVLACCVELNLRAHNHPSTAGLRIFASHIFSDGCLVCVATHQHPARSNRATRYDTTADLSPCTVYYV